MSFHRPTLRGLAAALAAGAMASSASALTINDYFDSSITSNANAAAIESAITFSSNQIASQFGNNMSVGVYYAYVNDPSFLGASESTFYFYDTANYNLDAAAWSAANPQNTVLSTGLAHVAGTDQNLLITGSALRAIGDAAPGGFDTSGNFTGNGPVDTVILLSSAYDLVFSGAVPTYDGSNLAFSGVDTIEHELTEALGAGGSGSNLNNIAYLQNGGTFGDPGKDAFVASSVGVLDQYRYSAPGVLSFSTDPAATAYFSIDGGATNLAQFNQYAQGDFADFGPTTTPCPGGGYGGPINLIQSAFTCNNEPTVGFSRFSPSGVELQLLGYNAVPEPAAWGLLVVGLGAIGATLRRRRTTVLANA